MVKGGGDARDWDEDGYRHGILQERDLRARTVFRTIFAPTLNPNLDPEFLVVASSDGTVAPYSISSCISSSNPTYSNATRQHQPLPDFMLAEPLCSLQGHTGPAYDVMFYGDGDDSLLLSCGDDGHICGWSWKEILNAEMSMPVHERGLKPIIDLVNPQHKGPWEALSPIPENNAIAINTQEGSIFSASGDACAYCWDVETSQRKMVFRGHSDYLHCVVTRKSSNQIITGSEDGTARIWDCRSGKCTKILSPGKGFEHNDFSWVSCIDIDTSESWLVCGTDKCLTVWSLPSFECIWSIDSRSPVQDVMFDANQILAVGSEPVLTRFNINGVVISQIQCAPQSVFSVSHHPSGVTAVGGYGGLVDVLSEFGSHLCTFCCRGM